MKDVLQLISKLLLTNTLFKSFPLRFTLENCIFKWQGMLKLEKTNTNRCSPYQLNLIGIFTRKSFLTIENTFNNNTLSPNHRLKLYYSTVKSKILFVNIRFITQSFAELIMEPSLKRLALIVNLKLLEKTRSIKNVKIS